MLRFCLLALMMSTSFLGLLPKADGNSLMREVLASSLRPTTVPEHIQPATSLASSVSKNPNSVSVGMVSQNTIYDGNLTIDANSSLQITNTTYKVNGYVFVYGNLTLVNSTLTTFPPPLDGSLIDPLGIWLFDYANVSFLNSTTFSPIGTHNSSSVLIENSNMSYIVPYTGSRISPTNLDTFGSSKARISNSILRWVETWDRSELTVNKSTITDIGPLGSSEVFVYNSTVRQLSAHENSVTNVYETSIRYGLDIELDSTVFLWNSSFPGIGPNDVPSFSIVVIGNGSPRGLVGARLLSKPLLAPGVKDGRATVEISSDSVVSGEMRFYWGVFVSEADTFQRLRLDKDGVRIVAWNGTGWRILQNQGLVDFGQNSGGYFWARFDHAGIYAIVSYPTSTPLGLWLLLTLPFAGLIIVIFGLRRRRVTKTSLST